MSMLKDKKCVMTKPGTSALCVNDKEELKQQLESNWKLIENNTQLFREFKFKSFKQSLELVNSIAVIAEEERHHPDISFGWGYCKITILTHTISDLVESDFILAAKIDNAYNQLNQ